MSLIKKHKINKYVPIDQACVVSISGVPPGECVTLGSVKVEINGFVCEAYVVPEDFPIDTDGLLGWDMLTKHEAKINAAHKRLEVGRLLIPFEKKEQFVIPPHKTNHLREISKYGGQDWFCPITGPRYGSANRQFCGRK